MEEGRWRKRWAIPLSSDKLRLLRLLLGFGLCMAEEVVATVVGRGCGKSTVWIWRVNMVFFGRCLNWELEMILNTLPLGLTEYKINMEFN